MKKVTKFFMAALLAGMCSFGYAQTQPDYMRPPKSNEKVIGNASYTISAGYRISNSELYNDLLQVAKKDYPDHQIDIREMQINMYSRINNTCVSGYYYGGNVQGKVVWIMSKEDKTEEFNNSISLVLNKALRNVREGSRLAIDQVTVISSMDREALKDQLLDVLLDKGYRVVAKDYLEKLYEEQEAQQSGIYNDKTTVQENNFSAVGYYINVKVTETSLRVQVVNVSTGEYEGNATVNF